jgi:hypothetical protein
MATAKENAYTVTHLVDGKIKRSEITSTITEVLAYVSTMTGIDAQTEKMRRNIAHSFIESVNKKPFIVTIVTKDDKKHVFRVDKHKLNIGVHIL